MVHLTLDTKGNTYQTNSYTTETKTYKLQVPTVTLKNEKFNITYSFDVRVTHKNRFLIIF